MNMFARLMVALAMAALTAAGQTLNTLYSFAGGASGANPSASVIVGPNKGLFGTTPVGGSKGFGTIYELTQGTPWQESVLYSFQGGADGANPVAALTGGTGGIFYGTTSAGGSTGNGTVFELKQPTKAGSPWTKTVIYTFRSPATGVVNVAGTVVTLVSGNSFPTGAPWNGVSIIINDVTYTIASVTSASSLTLTTSASPVNQSKVNYTVTAAPPGPWVGWPDGSNPQGDVILLNGNLYGTTFGGGNTGAGTVFQLTPPAGGTGAWPEKVIYNFQGGKDGSGPGSGLTASSGALYGSTCCGTVGGTVFKLGQTQGGAWSKAPVYSFSSYSVGQAPFGGLAIDAKGVLYGTTIEGGKYGAGIVFSLTPPATAGNPYTLTTIHSFTNGNDGGAPYGAVTLGASGVLYATVTVGCSFGVGGVLQFTPPSGGSGPWTETVLYNFTGGLDGAQPFSGVILNNNILYGTTVYDGAAGYGTVFGLTL